MKNVRILLVTFFAAFTMVLAAHASDPSGTWTWTSEGRNGPRETTAEFELKDGVLTGSIAARNNEIPIENATFKDGMIAFSITMGRNGNDRVMSYQGKVEDGIITGTVKRPGRNGDSNEAKWKASKQN